MNHKKRKLYKGEVDMILTNILNQLEFCRKIENINRNTTGNSEKTKETLRDININN